MLRTKLWSIDFYSIYLLVPNTRPYSFPIFLDDGKMVLVPITGYRGIYYKTLYYLSLRIVQDR